MTYTDTRSSFPGLPTAAESKKAKVVYDRWAQHRNPALDDFRQAVHAMAAERGWPVRKVLRWAHRRTGVSVECLANWMEGGPTRHPSMRTFPYVMRIAFGIVYERMSQRSAEGPIDLAAVRQRRRLTR